MPPPAPVPPPAVPPPVPPPTVATTSPYVQPVPYGMDWARVDRRANTTFYAGAITWGAGRLIETVSTDIDVATVGSIAGAAGVPIMAGASLRARKSLNRRGAQVSAAGGTTSWVLWSLSFLAMGSANWNYESFTDQEYDQIILGASLIELGAIGAVVGQELANMSARRRLTGVPRPGMQPQPAAAWSPPPPPVPPAPYPQPQ